MPNNRGGIPMYNENPQYNATISSQFPQGSPASFGTQVAKEMAGMGDAIGKLGTTVVDWAVKMQERDDNAFILEKDNQMRQAMTDLLYNPQTGLANQKGKNSFGVTQTYDEEIEKLTQNAMSEIGSPVLKAKLQEHNMQWVNSLRTTIAKHEGNERFTFYSNQITGGKTNAVNLGTQIGGISGMQTSSSIIAGLKGRTMDLLGWDETMADNWEKEANSEAFTLIADDYVQRGDIGGLQSLVDSYGDKVSANALAKAKTKLKVINQQQDAAKLAEQLIAEHPELIDEDGNLDEAKYAELVDQLNGENAADRVERVLVGGSYFQDTELNGLIDAAAQKYKVDPLLVAALASVESSGNQDAVSPVGAVGVMQLTKDTAKELGVDRSDKAQNVDGGTKYLKQMLDTFGGDVKLAVAAYNAGPSAVKEAGNQIPNYKETKNHVDKVMTEYERLKSQVGTVASIDVGSAIDKAWNDYADKSVPLPEGTNGCAHAANYFVAYFNPWSKGQIEKGGRHMSYVPQLVKDAQEAGAPGVEDFKEANLKKGDMIVYKAANDPEGMNHVVVYAGDGAGDYRYVGNSSRANNNQGGIVQGADYRNMGSADNPLTPQYIIKTSPERNGGGHYIERRVSGYNPVLNSAMKAYGKRKADMIKGESERQITAWANALFENPNVINARDQSEIDVEMDKMGIPRNKRAKVMNRVQYSMGVNNSHISRVRSDVNWNQQQMRISQAQAQDNVSAWILGKIQRGETFTSADIMDLPDFGNMDKSNALSMIQHMKSAEASNDPYAGWYKGDNQFAFEKAVSSMKKQNNLDDMYVPNIRSAITAANAERKKNGQPPMDSGEIEKFVAGQSMNWKVKGRLWGYNSSEQPRAALQPGQYVSEDGRTVYDAEGTPLVWDDDMKMYRRPN